MSTTLLPPTMEAQVLHAFNTPYTLSTLPIPTPTERDILLRVGAAGFCHTDAVFASGLMSQKLPRIGSHEFAGTAVALGPNVDTSKIQLGMRVGSFGRAYRPCGSCWECRNNGDEEDGYSAFCPKAGNLGLTEDGGFAEYVCVDSRQVAPIPGQLSFVDTAPLMCAGYTIYSAFKKCNLPSGARVGVIGCGGGLGHLALQFGIKMGYQLVGIDNQDATLRLARDLNTGAAIFDARVTQPDEVLAHIHGGEGRANAERGLEAVLILPESQKAFDYGFQLLKNHGLGVVVSFPAQGLSFSARNMVFRQLQLVGILPGRQSSMREMLKFTAEHDVRSVTKTYPLAKLNDLVEEYHKCLGGKLVVDMSL